MFVLVLKGIRGLTGNYMTNNSKTHSCAELACLTENHWVPSIAMNAQMRILAYLYATFTLIIKLVTFQSSGQIHINRPRPASTAVASRIFPNKN
jgi:hypothetical protein